MENKTIEKKALKVDINERLHKEIKTRAAFKGLTIKKWITNAIIEHIKLEEKYQ